MERLCRCEACTAILQLLDAVLELRKWGEADRRPFAAVGVEPRLPRGPDRKRRYPWESIGPH